MTAPKTPPRWTDPDSRRSVLIVCVFLVVAVWLVFGQTVRYGFVNFDDDAYFTSNYHVKAGLTWSGVSWAFRTGHASNWHPLTWLSLMLDAQLSGPGPMGPHLTNVILHAANAVLLFLLLKRLTRTLWPSACVAMMFAIHPLHVESVAWVAERKDVLSGFFFMLTLLMYVQYVEQSKLQRPGSKVSYGLALLFFALGLMSKPMLVTLPFVLLLLDWWPLGRVAGENNSAAGPSSFLSSSALARRKINHLLLEKLPFLLLCAASCVATILAQREAIKSMIVLPLTLRLNNAMVSVVIYLKQMVWPANLAAFYPYRFDMPAWQVAGAGTLLLCITLLAWRTAQRFPCFLVGWLWYLGMLVPVIGLVQVGGQAHADRYTYLPHIGLAMVFVWVLRDCTISWRYRHQILVTMGSVVIGVWMVCSRKQTACWQNDESLWTHALACTSENYTAHNNLGYVLVGQGRTAEAIKHYQEALAINPNYSEVINNLGTALLDQGRLDEAAKYYHRAIEIYPGFAEAYNNLGILLTKQGQAAEAIEYYRKSIELNPNRAEFYNNFGNLLATQGQPPQAIEQFQKALEVEPDNAKVRYNLANVLTAQGRRDEAIEQFQQVLKQMPDSIHARYQLGLLLQSQGRFAPAVAQLQKVLELDPKHVMAQNNLAWLLATCPDDPLRNGKKAVELAQSAVQLSGGASPEILDTLAAAYAEAGRFPEAITTARQASDLSTAKNNKPLTEAIQTQLRLYEVHSPDHEQR
jgi:tetratricopeptide (TPR) repeat protein